MREYLDKKEKKNLIKHYMSAIYWGKQVGMYPSGKYKSFTTRDNVFVIEEKNVLNTGEIKQLKVIFL